MLTARTIVRTRGSRSAAAVSMARTCACAWGERKMRPMSRPCVDRIADRACDLGPAVQARMRFADNGKLNVGRQRRRLVGGNLPLLAVHADADDADGERFGAHEAVLRHGSDPLRFGRSERRRDDMWVAAASADVAADRALN